MNMMKKLMHLFFGLLILTGCATNHEQKVNSKLENSIAHSDIKWSDILETFDDFLTTSGLKQDNMTKGEAYLSYLKFRQEFSPQNMVEFKQREELKELLIKSGILNGSELISGKFAESFIPFYKDNNDISDDVFVNTCELASTLKEIPNLSSQAIIGGILMMYKASDLDKELYQKVIIMTSVIDFIYLDELLTDEVSNDSPYKKLIENQSKTKKRKVVAVEE